MVFSDRLCDLSVVLFTIWDSKKILVNDKGWKKIKENRERERKPKALIAVNCKENEITAYKSSIPCNEQEPNWFHERRGVV